MIAEENKLHDPVENRNPRIGIDLLT